MEKITCRVPLACVWLILHKSFFHGSWKATTKPRKVTCVKISDIALKGTSCVNWRNYFSRIGRRAPPPVRIENVSRIRLSNITFRGGRRRGWPGG